MERLGRDEILDAIRAWVNEHGVVPGSRAFESHHQVSRSAFQGTYWASWSDAVREAGFEPYQSNPALDPDVAMASYVALIRRLGRMPTYAETRYEKKLDPAFPSRAFITRRFGSTAQERADTVRDWCNARDDMSDVLALLPPVRNNADWLEGTGATAGAAASEGYVYLLHSNGLYKVGMTRSVPRRWAEVAGAAPAEVDLVHYFRTDDPVGIELYWHRRFADARRGGEWFALSKSDLQAFKRRRKFM